jgi:hypothetical protein
MRWRVLVRAMVAVALVAGVVAAPQPAAAATITIGGYLYHDLDADGQRDPGEPAPAGLRVHHISGAPATTTDADGRYSLADLPTRAG